MSTAAVVKDLVVLAADRNAEYAVKGILERPLSLGLGRTPDADFYVHPEHDAGCLLRAHQFLNPFVRGYRHALVLFDREGCGQETRGREALEQDVERRLDSQGWQGRAATVVFDPELEIWVWSESPHIDMVLGWSDRTPGLRPWLRAQRLWEVDAAKPTHPKEAMEAALRHARKARSSSLYRSLAQKVGFERCTDPSFHKFRDTLRRWFG